MDVCRPNSDRGALITTEAAVNHFITIMRANALVLSAEMHCILAKLRTSYLRPASFFLMKLITAADVLSETVKDYSLSSLPLCCIPPPSVFSLLCHRRQPWFIKGKQATIRVGVPLQGSQISLWEWLQRREDSLFPTRDWVPAFMAPIISTLASECKRRKNLQQALGKLTHQPIWECPFHYHHCNEDMHAEDIYSILRRPELKRSDLS